MTTMQVNAELYRAMGEIADNKVLMEKVLAFVKSLIQKQKKARKTMMTKGLTLLWQSLAAIGVETAHRRKLPKNLDRAFNRQHQSFRTHSQSSD